MGQFRVMLWNVQNLFPAGHEDGPKSNKELDNKLASLGALIDEVQPHVLALQELGDKPTLRRLQDVLQWKMKHSALARPDQRGIGVGFISRRVLSDVENVQMFPTGLLPIQTSDAPHGPEGPGLLEGMSRAALAVTVRANNRNVRLVTCHLKSKLLTYPGGRFFAYDSNERARVGAYAMYRRASEASTIRTYINADLDGNGRTVPYILAGDFNDEVDAATTQILNGPPGSEIGTTGFARPDKGDKDRLWNLAPLIAEDQRFSRIYRGRKELIDHIFTSHFLVSNGHTTSVRTATALPAGLPSIEDNPTEQQGKPGSDHAAVIATFDF